MSTDKNSTKALVIDSGGNRRWFKGELLHRDDGPSVILSNGASWWFKDGKMHREDGPAVLYHSGTRKWLIDNKMHRIDGPAVERPNGTVEWYANNHHCSNWQEFQEHSKLSDEEIVLLVLKYGEIE